MSKTLTNFLDETELEIAFVHELQSLIDQGEEISMRLTTVQAWSLLGAVQLAARHPETAESSCIAIAAAIGRVLQDRVATSPAMAEVARRGWIANFDTESGKETK